MTRGAPFHCLSPKSALLPAICLLAACSNGASGPGSTGTGGDGGTDTAGAGGSSLGSGGASGKGGAPFGGSGGASSGGTGAAGGASGAGASGATTTTGGGTTARGGAAGTSSTGGATSSGGRTASDGGSSGTGTGATAGTGGRGGSGGSTGSGGTRAAGGAAGTGGATGAGGAGATCGATPNPLPFDCKFAWGVNGGNPSSFNYVQFISNWAGYNIRADGTFSSCDECGWLKSTMANATQVPALISYVIGYWGHVNGLPDGNQNPNGPNLSNGMGALLLGSANAACPQGPPETICADNLMVKAYAWYAAQIYASYKKPIIWLMEGDFIQYSPEGTQTTPLSYDQTGQLAAQITAAIKCNDPPAIVAWNYSTWISASQRDSYFSAINANVAKLGTSWEMVWTSGKGNTTSAGTGTTWDQLYAAAGNKPIISDESFGLSVSGDTWANQTAATIEARIAQHVVAADITTSTTPSYLQTNVTTTLAPSALGSTCP